MLHFKIVLIFFFPQNILFAGEDRWLCTLLLQAGYRVEYSAASDSFTQAPEGRETNQTKKKNFSTASKMKNFYYSLQIHNVMRLTIFQVYMNFTTRDVDGCHLLWLTFLTSWGHGGQQSRSTRTSLHFTSFTKLYCLWRVSWELELYSSWLLEP